jgi:quercetin dioxygenase-like cupin family protein
MGMIALVGEPSQVGVSRSITQDPVPFVSILQLMSVLADARDCQEMPSREPHRVDHSQALARSVRTLAAKTTHWGPNMNVTRAGSQSSNKGPADWFTGTVRIDPLFAAPPPARAAGARVTFEPGARTAWHTHPLGQTLIVTDGAGFVQREGGPVEEIRPGDVVWFPPNEKHWHGASATTAMTHIAIQESLDGKAVDWMEKVTDEQYGAARAAGMR